MNRRETRTPRGWRGFVVAATVLALYAAIAAVTFTLLWRLPQTARAEVESYGIVRAPLVLFLQSLIAALVLARYPRHPIGWLLATMAIGFSVRPAHAGVWLRGTKG